MHCKLRQSEDQQAHVSSMLSAEKQAHSVAAASLQQIQQEYSKAIKDLHQQVWDSLMHSARLRF